MRRVQPENLIALVEFFYRGQASVYQGNLDSFLALAKDLELKGLKGNQTEEDVEVNHPQTVSRDLSRVNQSGSDKYHQILSDLSCETDNVEPGTKVVDSPKHQAPTNTDIESLGRDVKAMMTFKEKEFLCKMCGKKGSSSQMRSHIERNRMTGISVPCELCGTTYNSRHGLSSHKSQYHRQIS